MTPVLEALAAARDRRALHDPRDTFTAGEALDTVYRLARALAEYGHGPGRVVALVGPISARMYLVSLAAQVTGGAQVEIPVAMPARDQAALVQRCRADLVVVDPDAADASAVEGPGVRVLALAPSPSGEDLFAAAERCSARPLAPRFRSGDPSRISLTGGTTGRAKPVLRRYRAPVHTRSPWARHLGQDGTGPRRVLKTERLTGLGRTLGDVAVTCGAELVTLPVFDPSEVLAVIRGRGITHLLLAPHQLRLLLDLPETAGADLSSLRCVVTATAAASPALLRRAVERLGPIVHATYGQTEAGHICWLEPEDYARTGPAASYGCGRPIPGAQVRIRDEGGADLAAGERGRVWVRTPFLMDEYLDMPEDTARVLREGWLDTGDVGFLNEEGFLTLLGRSTDAMVVGGEVVYSAEVDALVQEHPAVEDSVTFDVPGEGGASLHTAVVLRGEGEGDVGEDELRALVAARLPETHVPSSFRLVSRIPLTYAHEPCWDTLRAGEVARTR
ncbi:class I adenylate-forming enzyme family protein [Nocardiopsis sp. NPDC057823]|uniref:class I adenylate-forming enzyme family protein n=1 Tax=Nocardiopsis sp. NPDC057823 TaxID=3346256 RepID=UPI00366E0BAA